MKGHEVYYSILIHANNNPWPDKDVIEALVLQDLKEEIHGIELEDYLMSHKHSIETTIALQEKSIDNKTTFVRL